MIPISEIFTSLAGEGKYVGCPMLFIRVSGCSQKCSFCDTQYHTEGKETVDLDIVDRIIKYSGGIVCFTGGEPLLYEKEIYGIIYNSKRLVDVPVDIKQFHLETNGDFFTKEVLSWFNFVSISPKHKKIAEQCYHICMSEVAFNQVDIKVVTDLKLNKDLLKYATFIMPLTTYNEKKDAQIRKDVWQYCIDNNKRYTPRLHYEIFGKKRGV